MIILHSPYTRSSRDFVAVHEADVDGVLEGRAAVSAYPEIPAYPTLAVAVPAHYDDVLGANVEGYELHRADRDPDAAWSAATAAELLYADLAETSPPRDDVETVYIGQAGAKSTPTPPEEAEEPQYIYLHLDITDGDGQVPPGIANDGTDYLTVTGAVRATAESDSPLVPISGPWRVTVANLDTGLPYTFLMLTLTSGQFSVRYSTTGAPARITIRDDDFAPFEFAGQSYQVRVVGSPVFWVYEIPEAAE